MKYITTKIISDNGLKHSNIKVGDEEIFIFDKNIHHDCFADVIRRIRSNTYGDWARIDREPIAAGFTDGKTCWGNSETLGLKSRGALDAALIK